MGEAITLGQILQFSGSLGTGVLFVFLYFKERAESQSQLNGKDQQLRDLNAQVLSAFQENTKSNTILSTSIVENTEATKTLTERVTDVIINRKGQ
jgi:hypothetical protein